MAQQQITPYIARKHQTHQLDAKIVIVATRGGHIE
jgi:hypothetical protein